MKRLLAFCFLAFIFFPAQVSSQTFNYERDYEYILEQTKDKKSDLYYKSLIKRFNKNDEHLTDYEILGLMIAFSDDPAYRPFKDIETEREIEKLNSHGDYRKAIILGNKHIEKHPLSLSTHLELSYSYFVYYMDLTYF